MVDYDTLTGALSRRALLHRGAKLLQRMHDAAQSTAVLMLDLDHFKNVNDQYGHASGDAVLQQFVQLAQQELRSEDVLGRMGGEEFAIVLPRTNAAQAQAVAQRLCAQLAQYAMRLEQGEHIRVTCSVGLAATTVGQDTPTLEKLMGWADQALYQAKASGRNQVCVQAAGAETAVER